MFLSQAAKVRTGFWWLSQDNLEKLIFYLTLLFLPTQLGRHFWPDFSYIYGIRIDYLSPTVYVSDILIIFLFLITITKKRAIKINKNFLFFLFYLLLTLLVSKYWQVGVYGFLKILEFSFFAFYCAYAGIKKEILIKVLAISFLFESLLSIGQFINKGSLGSFFYFLGERSFNGQTPGIANASINGELILRPYGTFSHPNVLAAFLLIIFTFVIFQSKKINVFYSLCLIIGAIALLITFSRIAIFLFGIIILFKLYLFLKTRSKSLLSLLPSIIILIAFLYIVFLSPFKDRFLNLSQSDLSIVQRGELSTASYMMFLKSPLFGLGINSFFVNLPNFMSQQKTFFIQPVHNIYLLLLSELGVFGLSFLLLLITKAFKKIIKMNNYLLGLLLVEILVLGFFDHYFFTLQQGQLLFALVVGLSFSKLKLSIE